MLDRTGASRQLGAWLDGGKSTRSAAELLIRDTADF
jgi:hypothetical protein